MRETNEVIRIGTRGSRLALWQAEYVASVLQLNGFKTEIVKIETKGDKILNVAIAKIGSKGVFTMEIEEQLKSGDIDIAVHSAKDLQSELEPGFELAAFTKREKVNDVLIAYKDTDLQKEGLVIGTSSTRRIATLKHFYPNTETKEIRGNLQTRLRKLEEGQYDAIILAYAGVKRMQYDHLIRHTFSADEFIPAVGQGTIAIEVHESLDPRRKTDIRNCLNDPVTEKCLLAERAYLKTLQGGCSIPVFALAETAGSQVQISGGIISLDGQERIVKSFSGEQPQTLGNTLAQAVLESGGSTILQSIKDQL